ncbi:MAG: Phosphatidylglycerophosphatase [Verrucomicrobiota bacterium]|jgi:phosphatidylglycerophosphatase A
MMVGIATLGPLGRLRAPGTWGSAAGLLWWALVVRNLARGHAWYHELVFDALVVLAAIFFCGVAAFLLKKKDPSEVILDEFVAMPLVFLFNKNLALGSAKGFLLVIVGFLLFRLFDITKPFGIKALEKLPGGFGIVLDDVMAAFYANLVLQGIAFLAA